MSEGTIENGAETPKPPRQGHWLRPDGTVYQRAPPPPGHRERRRWVTVCESDVPRQGRNGRTFGYNVKTVARLVNLSPSVVRRAIRAKELVMHDLECVLQWVIARVRPCPAGRIGDPAVAPPLWSYYDNFTLLWGGPRTPWGPNQVHLAVPMPLGEIREDMTRMFWKYRGTLNGWAGSGRELARLIYELDGVKREDMPTTKVGAGATALRTLVRLGVLTHDKVTRIWRMAKFPITLEAVADGLRAEGFESIELKHDHIWIGRDAYSLSDSRRLLAYMRTNRIKAKDCGRDKRIWIVGGMDRAMHGYKERKVFRFRRQSGFGVPAERVSGDAPDRGLVPRGGERLELD